MCSDGVSGDVVVASAVSALALTEGRDVGVFGLDRNVYAPLRRFLASEFHASKSIVGSDPWRPLAKRDGDTPEGAETNPSPFNDSLSPIDEDKDVGVLVPGMAKFNDVGGILEK